MTMKHAVLIIATILLAAANFYWFDVSFFLKKYIDLSKLSHTHEAFLSFFWFIPVYFYYKSTKWRKPKYYLIGWSLIAISIPFNFKEAFLTGYTYLTWSVCGFVP